MSTSTDPIADMLTRIRNAIGVRKSEVNLPHSKTKEAIAKILADNNFIDGVTVSGTGIDKTLSLTLYSSDSNPRISGISRISKPGHRKYVITSKIPTIKYGRGLVIISTSRGLMTGQEAKRQRVGGELVCEVF